MWQGGIHGFLVSLIVLLGMNLQANAAHFFSNEDVIPFCAGENDLGISYPAGTDSVSAFSFSSGCLIQTPSPQWFIMQIEEPGLLGITIEHEDGYDVDFACYGPFEAASKQELIDKINGDSSVFVFHDGYSFNSIYAPDDSICYPQSYLDALDRMVFIEDSIYALCIEDLFLRDISEFNDYDEYQEYWDEESEKESKCLQEKYEECNVVYPPDPVQFDINNPCFRGYYDDFPYDKMADCSYSPSSKEFCYLPDAKAGEWYLLLITNFESKPGTISFKQTAGTATNNCKIIVDAMLLEPACEGGPIKLDVNNAPENATFSWIGPNGFSSTERNPIIYNATQENAGVYTLVMVGSNGIASGEVEVPVVVHEKQTENVIESIQMGETFMFGDEELTAPGTYQKTFVSELTGCDSTVNLTLELSEQNVVIGFNVPCEGEDLSFEVVAGVPENIACLWTGPNGFSSTERNPVIHNVTQDHAGTYSFSITSNGFDVPSIDADIEVSPIQRTELTDSIYPGDTYLFNGTPLSAAGTYYDTLSCALTGCDSIVTLKLAMKGYDPILLSNNGPLCEGETLSFEVTTNTPADASFSWTGPDGFSSSETQPTLPNVTEAQSGTYSLTITANGVALSTVETDVVVNPTLRTELTDSIYPGDTYLFNGTSLSAAGTYHDTLLSVLTGCDSIVTLKLTMRGYDPVLLTNNGPLCEGETLSFGVTTNAPADASFSWTGPDGFSSSEAQPTLPNVTEAQSGTYSLTITANGVALSTVETDVVVNLSKHTELTDFIYSGEVYPFNGTSISAAGTYHDTLASALTGCDSIVTLVLTVEDSAVISNNGPLCEGETLILNLDEAPNGVALKWEGPNAFASTEQNPSIEDVTILNAGLYSVEYEYSGRSFRLTTPVVVNKTKTATVKAIIKGDETYRVGDEEYTESGEYNASLVSSIGCDSIVHLTLVKINTIELLPDEVFTPNSDGIRDRWTIKNVESYAQLDVTIYDRTGKIVRVFNAYDNLENSWDGKDDRGNDLPSSDYWYVINVAESDVQYVGHVTLSR